jgi:hypothetical protein
MSQSKLREQLVIGHPDDLCQIDWHSKYDSNIRQDTTTIKTQLFLKLFVEANRRYSYNL